MAHANLSLRDCERSAGSPWVVVGSSPVSSLYTSSAVMNAEICARALPTRITGLSGIRSSIETTSKQQTKIMPTKIHEIIFATRKYRDARGDRKDESRKPQGRKTALSSINGVRCHYKFQLWKQTPHIVPNPCYSLAPTNPRVARFPSG